jgi:hypothetical protein
MTFPAFDPNYPKLDDDVTFRDGDVLQHVWTGVCAGLGDGTIRLLVPCWGHGYDEVKIRPEQIISIQPWQGPARRVL